MSSLSNHFIFPSIPTYEWLRLFFTQVVFQFFKETFEISQENFLFEYMVELLCSKIFQDLSLMESFLYLNKICPSKPFPKHLELIKTPNFENESSCQEYLECFDLSPMYCHL